MTTTISQHRKALPRTIVGFGLVLALVAGTGVAPAGAKTLCAFGNGVALVNLPFVSEGAYSQFYFRVDGGQWQVSPWYYSNGDSAWIWDGAWQYLSLAESGPTFTVGSGWVDAYEHRFTPSNWGYWVYHEGCNAWSFAGGGIVLTTN
jgi:hypothetical protein